MTLVSSDGGGSIALLNNLPEKFFDLVEEELIPQSLVLAMVPSNSLVIAIVFPSTLSISFKL
jgi:hypothetical protein